MINCKHSSKLSVTVKILILWSSILNRFVRNIIRSQYLRYCFVSEQTALALIILRPISKCVTQRNGVVHLYGNEDVRLNTAYNISLTKV